ncbi:hypothetical protein BN426_5240 [Klebsiella pneumoniae subsp. pneumoniae ST258-K26BO]|nr:hypothetical protein BN426_5240 [Klebsiella pneumoniae subsp. pneumoniae ST258-K26BO]
MKSPDVAALGAPHVHRSILLPIKPYMNKTDRNEQKHYH